MARFLKMSEETSLHIDSIHTISKLSEDSVTFRVNNDAYQLDIPKSGITVEDASGLLEYARNQDGHSISVKDAIHGYWWDGTKGKF